jgi:hypothetical protein
MPYYRLGELPNEWGIITARSMKTGVLGGKDGLVSFASSTDAIGRGYVILVECRVSVNASAFFYKFSYTE